MNTTNWRTRLSLLERAQNPDDEQAWSEFTEYYSQFVTMVTVRLGVHSNDRDDLTQEIILSLWKSLPKLQLDYSKGRFRSWISSIINRRVVDHYRKVKSLATKNERLQNQIDKIESISEPEIEDIIQEEWKAYVIQIAMQNIAPVFSGKAMDVFTLSMKGKSTEDIATELDLKNGSIRKLKSRVKERLLKEIELLKAELDPFYG